MKTFPILRVLTLVLGAVASVVHWRRVENPTPWWW